MMRNSTKMRLAGWMVLLASLSAPMQAGAFFWSGPGCFVADMLGMGSPGAGLHFSVGTGAHGAARGFGYGYPYGYPPPPAAADRFAHRAPPMPSATKPPHRSTPSARDTLDANLWSDEMGNFQHVEADGRDAAPRNRWYPGR